MADDFNPSHDAHRRFGIAQLAWYGGMWAVVLIITFASNWVQSDNIERKFDRRQEAINSNRFWHALTGEREPGTTTSYGKMARDLRPFLQDTEIKGLAGTSKLIPKDLREINVEDGRYPDLTDELGWSPFQYNPEATCRDCGKFSGDFLAQFALAQDGKTRDLIVDIPPVPSTHKNFTFDLPAYLFYPGLAAVFGVASFLLAIAIHPPGARNYFGGSVGYDYVNKRNWSFNGQETGWKLASTTMAWPLFIPRWIIRSPWVAGQSVGRWSRRIDAERAAKRKENPVQVELRAAQNNLARLHSLSPEQLAIPEIKKALSDTEKLVAELSDFPEYISDRSARLVARQVLRENKELRDRPKALIEGYKTVEGEYPD